MNIQEIVRSMGLQMRKARQLKNDRQMDLAARIGVSRLTIMKMEKGEAEAARVPLETWLKASAHLNILHTWHDVMQIKADPFDEYDKNISEEKQIRKARVKKQLNSSN